MTSQQVPQLTAGDIARSLSRHTKKAISLFCLIVTATVCWIVFAPGEYESISKVYVRVGRENNTLDPSATTGQTVNIQQTLESEINSMLEILGSRETVKRVVEEIGVDAVLANDINDPNAIQSSSSSSGGIKSWLSDLKDRVLPNRFEESREERAIRSILKRSDFWAPKKSNVLEISCRAGHPKLAQMIADAWTTAFITENLRVTRTSGSLPFFIQEVDELESRLKLTEDELMNAKSTSGLVSIEGQRKVLEDQSNAIRTRLLTNKSLLSSSEAKVKQLQLILENLPARVEADLKTAESHEGWYKLREKLFELQIKEQELKSKFSDQNSEVIAVIQQREAIEKILATQSQSSSESISRPNPTHQVFHQSLLNEQALAASLIAENRSLEQQMEECLTEFKSLNKNSVRINELERRRQNLETSYLASFARMEQAKILQGLEAANISSVNQLQRASFSARPVGFGRLKTLLAGTFLALIAGLGIVFIAEYFNRTFVTSRQVENTLEVPVLVSIPERRRQFIDLS